MKILELKNISVDYKENKIIDNFSMTIFKQEIVAITGPSGSGKSSLLYIMGLLNENYEGELSLFNEINPKFDSDIGRELLYTKIGFIFQNNLLLENKTVSENIDLVLDEKGLYTKLEALEFVGLKNYEEKKVYMLSGGEQQRVALARVLTKQFDVLLADEMTGNLDFQNRDIVFAILQKVKEIGKTIVLVTHDLELAKKCDREVKINAK